MKILNVAEKPSVAKEITQILGRRNARKKDGFSKFNPVWEFDCVLQGQEVTMVFTSVAGHLMGMDFEEPFRKNWLNIDPKELFSVPVVKFVPESMEPLKRTLQREAHSCSKLILWLDCDREGENIAFEVVQVVKQIKPNIPFLRAHFSAVIPQEIHRALTTLTEPNIYDSLAVDARMELDLRIGAAFTRFQTLRLQNRFGGLSESVISYGPCQFPTLGFVVERYLKIQNFVPEEFWKITCSVERPEGQAEFNWQRDRLFDHLTCLILYEMCAENPEARVINIEAKPKKKYRPFPLTTVELQKLASRKLHMSSDLVMKLAEKIYQAGYISYPRTETDTFPPGTDFQSLIAMHTQHPSWGEYAQMLQDGGFVPPKKGNHNDNSHPPIHPTKFTTSLTGKEKELYEFIVRHFLACCSQDAIGKQTIVTIDIAGEIFTCKGLVIEELNWLKVYPYEKWSDKSLPNFQLDETFIPTSLLMTNSFTTPPSLLTEADLIALMDQNGIGTDATIAQHIQTIQDRGYAVKTPQNQFTPTTLGVALVEGYKMMELAMSEPQLRAETEADIVAISKQTKTKDDVVRTHIAKYKEIFQKVLLHANLLDEAIAKHFDPLGTSFVHENKGFSICGKCENLMDLRENDQQSKVLYCTTCTNSYPVPKNGELSPHQQRCPLCNFQVVSVSKESTNWTFCPYCRTNPPSNQPNANQNSFNCFNCSANCPLAGKKLEVPIRSCPQCNVSNLVIKKRKDGIGYFLGCKNYPTCNATLKMPEGLRELLPTETVCLNCITPTKLIKFIFKNNSVPPGLRIEYDGCISGCNEALNDLLSELNRNFSTFFNPPPQTSNFPLSSTSSYNSNNFQRQSSFSSSPPSFPSSSSFQKNFQSSSFPSNSSSSVSNFSSQPHSSSSFSSDITPPLCPGHQESCVIRTTKDGANKGRQFFVCSRPPSDQCKNSFIWLDEYSPNGNNNNNNNNFSSSSSFQGLCFKCKQPGHFANNCPNNTSTSSFSSSNFSNNYSSSFKSSPPSKGPKRKSETNNYSSTKMDSVTCFKCNQPGHYATNCPNGNKGFGNFSSQEFYSSSSFSASIPSKKKKFNPSDSSKPRKPRTCSLCGQEGHTKRFHNGGGEEE